MISVQTVVDATAAEFRVSDPATLIKKQWFHNAHIRHAAMFIAVEKTGFSQSQVARRMQIHPSTVSFATKQVPKLIALDPDFAASVNRIIERIELARGTLPIIEVVMEKQG